jgi:hypothetical protein
MPSKKSGEINKELLSHIVAGKVSFVSQPDGLPMLQHVPPLIEVNTAMLDPNDNTKAAVRATAAAGPYLAGGASNAALATSAASNYAIITGAVLPEAKKRGNLSGSGAPTKYPFADLPIGGMFFSANSEHAKGDAVKALGSTVSAQNNKYATQKMENGVGITKTVTRAVRDKTTHKAQVGPDGKKVTETVDLPVKQYERKFTIRPVIGGQKYGDWVAPADGALIGRTV